MMQYGPAQMYRRFGETCSFQNLPWWWQRVPLKRRLESSWNVMAHDDAREGMWGGNWRMQWVASTLHTTSEHGVSSISTADAHTSAANSRLNWRPRRFKWARPFRRKTKSGFCACAITFQTQSTHLPDHMASRSKREATVTVSVVKMSDLTSTVFGFWRQTAAENVDTSYNRICVTSVFRREVEENHMMGWWDRQVVPKRR